MSREEPVLLLQHKHFLMNPQKQQHPLLKNKTLRKAVWTVSWKSYLRETFQRRIPNLIQVHDDQAHCQVTVCPGHCGLAAVIKEKFIHFDMT